MKLRIGALVPGSETPVGDGASRPVRAVILVDGTLHAAIVKRIPLENIVAECFCAILLRAWKLPVPEPVLVRDGDAMLFASLESVYPSLKQRIGWRPHLPDDARRAIEDYGIRLVCGLPDAALALAADEVIANADRNLGNILWDGAEHAYIDHERTLGLVPFEHNLLALFAIYAGKAEAIEKAAVAAALTLSSDVLHKIDLTAGLDAGPSVEYVEKRLPVLAMRILDRFPKPSDLLSHVS